MDHRVAFIAFQEQDNLGVAYISSVLMDEGIKPILIDFRLQTKQIIDAVIQNDPILVGFSVIFQYHLSKFRDLIDKMRAAGIDCHFTAGGHFPSLRHKQLLKALPGLDSVALFEGEWTTRELVLSLVNGRNWRKVTGLAYRQGKRILTSGIRALEKDLDNSPVPLRPPLREYAFGKKYATLISGRGCVFDCSFCSIRQFYRKPAGPLKRLRRPENVVREMELLHHEEDCALFLFQDDDFPVGTRADHRWVQRLCSEIHRKGLASKIMWKINCRPDEVDPGLFEMMKEAGLFLVYLGIESGNDSGLQVMNKHATARQNLQAVKVLRSLDIEYDFGFMLLHPFSTFSELREDLAFLEDLCGDGSSPITFCKMMPYAETRIERQLRKEGRLIGAEEDPDYHFLKEGLGDFFLVLARVFNEWITDHGGLLNMARWFRYNLQVYARYFGKSQEHEIRRDTIRSVIARSNRYFLTQATKMADLFSESHYPDDREVSRVKGNIDRAHRRYVDQLHRAITQMEADASTKRDVTRASQ